MQKWNADKLVYKSESLDDIHILIHKLNKKSDVIHDPSIVVQVVVDKPLAQGFDYLWDEGLLGVNQLLVRW